MRERFKDRTVLVTGASRGLGRAIALAFGAEGAYVALNCRASIAAAEEAAEAIRASGGQAEVLPFDVRDQEAVRAAVAGLEQRRGVVDVLVNNSGIVGDNWFAMADPAVLDEVMDVNLGGAFRVTQAVIMGMIGNGSGSIVNIGSIAGMVASPGQSIYAASKGALLALGRTLGSELAPRGIRVNTIVPGLIDAGMVKRADRRRISEAAARIPMGRLGRAEEVAAATLFMASDDASYITGQVLIIDGGITL